MFAIVYLYTGPGTEQKNVLYHFANDTTRIFRIIIRLVYDCTR